MANINDVATGDPLYSDMLNPTIPVEYDGMTIDQIYDDWCTELGVSNSGNDTSVFSTNYFNPMVQKDTTTPLLEGGGNRFVTNARFTVAMYYSNISNSTTRLTHTLDLSGFADGLGDNFNNFRFAQGKFPSLVFYISQRSNSNNENWIVSSLRSKLAADGTLIVDLNLNDDGSGTTEIRAALRFNPESGGIHAYVESLSQTDYSIGVLAFDNSQDIPSSSTTIVPDHLTAYEIPITGINYFYMPPPLITLYRIAGTVKDGATALERDIYIYDKSDLTTAFAQTRSDANGDFSIEVPGNTPYLVMCVDEGADPKNAIVYDNVYGAII